MPEDLKIEQPNRTTTKPILSLNPYLTSLPHQAKPPIDPPALPLQPHLTTPIKPAPSITTSTTTLYKPPRLHLVYANHHMPSHMSSPPTLMTHHQDAPQSRTISHYHFCFVLQTAVACRNYCEPNPQLPHLRLACKSCANLTSQVSFVDHHVQSSICHHQPLVQPSLNAAMNCRYLSRP